MTLRDWLARIEQLHSRDIELGLERLMPVARRLGVTQLPCPVITVAGTNGKGSTVALIEALAQARGLNVCCYTSPHIHAFNERVRINGRMAEDATLVAACERVERAREGVPLTYFEFTTLVALDCFSRAAPELAVLEVGLGGRLDAVNLVDADVAVVTSIGLDHTDWLGDTREAIAREKCGIARTGRPLVYGELDRPASVDQCCETLSAPLLAAGRQFGAGPDGVIRWLSGGAESRVCCDTARLGHDNLATAVQALALLELLPQRSLISEVAAGTRLAGRCQAVTDDGVEWLFDVGHNREAVARLVAALAPRGRTRVVIGMLGDKPARATLALLAPLADQWFLLGLPPPRGLSAEALLECLPEGAQPVQCHDNANALTDALGQVLEAGDRVLVLGSFLTVDAVAAARGWNLFKLAATDAGIPVPERTQ